MTIVIRYSSIIFLEQQLRTLFFFAYKIDNVIVCCESLNKYEFPILRTYLTYIPHAKILFIQKNWSDEDLIYKVSSFQSEQQDIVLLNDRCIPISMNWDQKIFTEIKNDLKNTSIYGDRHKKELITLGLSEEIKEVSLESQDEIYKNKGMAIVIKSTTKGCKFLCCSETKKMKKNEIEVIQNYIDSAVDECAKKGHPLFEGVNCLCGSNDFTTVFYGNVHHARKWGYWKIVRCNTCDHRFLNPRPNIENISNNYEDDYAVFAAANSIEKPDSHLRKINKKLRSAALTEHFDYPGGKKIFWKLSTFFHVNQLNCELVPKFRVRNKIKPALLEIGCAKGDRLQFLQKLGWDVTGVEISRCASEIANSKGLRVINSAIESIDFEKEQFDSVIMSMVLEHLHDPVSAINKISTWLKPGGELLISIPNPDGLESMLFKGYAYTVQSPYHLHFYSRSMLKKILSEYTFKVFHQVNGNDIRRGIVYKSKSQPMLISKILAKCPKFVFNILGYVISSIGISSRISVRAVKKTRNAK